MAVFSVRNVSESTVPATSKQIWQLITDPEALADMTPLVKSIEPSGSHWRWTLQGVGALGLNLDAAFTERMEFDIERQIRFSHDPQRTRRKSPV